MSTHEELQAQIEANAGCATPMPQYQCHKKVWALKIKEIVEAPGDMGAIIIPADHGFSPFSVTKGYVLKHNPQAGGYFVVYEDGYKSFSPAKAFEDGYSQI